MECISFIVLIILGSLPTLLLYQKKVISTMRNFIIWLDSTNEWEIREVGLKDYTILKPLNIDAFANIRVSNNKIVYIHDLDIKVKDINTVSKEALFNEECNFYINNPNFLKEYPQKNAKKFKGTFISALNFIKDTITNSKTN